jgi:two-component system NarL family response regulator
MAVTRVLLVEDNRLLREGAIAILNFQPDLKAGCSAAGSGDILEKVREFKPHVVLLDIGMPTQNSFSIMRSIRRLHPRTELIALNLIPDSSHIARLVKEGVAGFIRKDATLDDFLSTIRSVAKGKKVLPPSLSASLLFQIAEDAVQGGDPKSIAHAIQLTQRELHVIDQISLGRSNKEIAETLCLSIHTVKSHIHSILDKLGLHTRLELAHFSHTARKKTADK